jgi:hypothetical protein
MNSSLFKRVSFIINIYSFHHFSGWTSLNRLQLLVLESYKILIFLYLLRKISDWYRVDTCVWGARSEKIRGLSREKNGSGRKGKKQSNNLEAAQRKQTY